LKHEVFPQNDQNSVLVSGNAAMLCLGNAIVLVIWRLFHQYP